MNNEQTSVWPIQVPTTLKHIWINSYFKSKFISFIAAPSSESKESIIKQSPKESKIGCEGIEDRRMRNPSLVFRIS